VLGAGQTLLDLSVAGAIGEHVVIDAPAPGEPARLINGSVIGTFPSPTGERLSLVRGTAHDGRPATLEEVVLGHMAAARTPRPTVLTVERAA
jgi:hypothetical protein